MAAARRRTAGGMAGCSSPDWASTSTARIAPPTTTRLTTNVNTLEASVPPGPLGWAPPLRPRRRAPRWAWLGVRLSVLTVLATRAAFVGLPYYTIAPGSARSVGGLIKVDGAQTYPARGRVLFTTVSVGPVRSVYQAVDGWLDPSVDVVSKDTITGGRSSRQYQQESLQD